MRKVVLIVLDRPDVHENKSMRYKTLTEHDGLLNIEKQKARYASSKQRLEDIEFQDMVAPEQYYNNRHC